MSHTRPDPEHPYVSRGGMKLAAALAAFDIPPEGWTCADLGCNVGGFTDCLLQQGARRVFAVDTGYGQLAWKLRQDARVTVLERTNALRCDPRTQAEVVEAGWGGCELVVIDLGWTRQQLAIPAAKQWWGSAATGRIITLVKPHYEADAALARGGRGVLTDAQAQEVFARVLEEFAGLGVRVLGHIPSPIHGGASRGKTGNLEFLVLLGAA